MEGLEIVMNLEKLEIYEVIDHDNPDNNVQDSSDVEKDYWHEARDRKLKNSTKYSVYGRALLSGRPYYLPHSRLWERKVIKDVSREEFTLAEIASEKEFQNGQIGKLNKSIESLKKAIEDDESTRESLNLEAKYLTGDDLTENQKDVAILESSIESKNQSIQVATDNIEKVKEKIATLDRKAAAIKDGTFEFSSPIETVEMGK